MPHPKDHTARLPSHPRPPGFVHPCRVAFQAAMPPFLGAFSWWGRLPAQCRSFFPRPDTCKNRGTEIDARDHAKTGLSVERLERPTLPAEIAGQKTSGIGLPACPTWRHAANGTLRRVL